jgi:hypothetical protein
MTHFVFDPDMTADDWEAARKLAQWQQEDMKKDKLE